MNVKLGGMEPVHNVFKDNSARLMVYEEEILDEGPDIAMKYMERNIGDIWSMGYVRYSWNESFTNAYSDMFYNLYVR